MKTALLIIILLGVQAMAMVTSKSGLWHVTQRKPFKADYEVLATHRVCGYVTEIKETATYSVYQAFLGSLFISNWTTVDSAEKEVEEACTANGYQK